jgi:hypothetical protein
MVTFWSVLLRRKFFRITRAVGAFNKGMICHVRNSDLKLNALSYQVFEEVNISHFQLSLFSPVPFHVLKIFVEHKSHNFEALSGASSPQISCYIVHCRAVCFTSFVLLLLLVLILILVLVLLLC